MRQPTRRRFPVGAEVLDGEGTHVRVWAPGHRRVEVVYGQHAEHAVALERERDGEAYFSGAVPGLADGGRYAFRLDGDAKLLPDPASRFQPDGPHEASAVVDPSRFDWNDREWRGVEPRGQVLYELHVGTFTPEGTYAAAIRELPALRDLGVTVVELLPLAEFPGRFGWGYDGVDLWAPTHLYGSPDDLRRFVDAAHRMGLGVILDVVYNHLGPDGNYLKAFSTDYFTARYKTEWGEAINFDGETSGPVREFYVENAGYWIEEFHLDGLRLDATQCIYDESPEHVITAIARRVRQAARGRATFITAENEPQEARLVRAPERGGYGLDALWNDDFHHSALAALTGQREAYYSDHRGRPQELISALRWGYLFQGQWYGWQKKRRGTPALDLAATNYVLYLENHDQVANSGRGSRLPALVAPDLLRAMTALLLLAPGTPMLFQGQEFGSSKPFLYFADHNPELAELVAKGRREFLTQFRSLSDPEAQAVLSDPAALETFERCKLDHGERETHAEIYALHRDLLALRRSEAAFRQQRADRMHGALLGADALLLRFCGDTPSADRLLLVNLGADLTLAPIPEPLLAPPNSAGDDGWRVLWSSEETRYGGRGTPPLHTDARWILPRHTAQVLTPENVT